ncbi:endo-1,4-beta-xylanase 5-like [Nicotiana tabacum]|uniref:Endo-1,4-beta-xylanase 5-like n=1 Tax=Nicotiana tabacum TaxID=4097 RepID=A0A1S3ZRH5_TOBAC|nr:PREDICTED: probable endo-1,4-beta-xylanase C [Nicotiana tabacum]
MPQVRKAKVKIQAVDSHGQSLPNTTVSLAQQKNNFPFGNAISQHILNNKAYQDWFTSRFKYTVFKNEMKWYANEKIPGQLDYNVADAMLSLVQKYIIKVRGHNVFWDNPQNIPSWAHYLSPAQLSSAASRRINSVMNRYLGQLIHWDVVNENVHFSFLEQILGKNASAVYYKKANEIDSKAIPFLNDFNTIEHGFDGTSNPAKYLEKIKELRSHGYNGPLGIGLQGHFVTPNLPYIRSSLDMLASAGLPIWITELDVANTTNQEMMLSEEDVLELNRIIWSFEIRVKAQGIKPGSRLVLVDRRCIRKLEERELIPYNPKVEKSLQKLRKEKELIGKFLGQPSTQEHMANHSKDAANLAAREAAQQREEPTRIVA